MVESFVNTAWFYLENYADVIYFMLHNIFHWAVSFFGWVDIYNGKKLANTCEK